LGRVGTPPGTTFGEDDMSNALLLAATEHGSTPAGPITFAIGTLIVFGALLGLTWSFRNFSNKHR
jgi:hypothetical protein